MASHSLCYKIHAWFQLQPVPLYLSQQWINFYSARKCHVMYRTVPKSVPHCTALHFMREFKTQSRVTDHWCYFCFGLRISPRHTETIGLYRNQANFKQLSKLGLLKLAHESNYNTFCVHFYTFGVCVTILMKCMSVIRLHQAKLLSKQFIIKNTIYKYHSLQYSISLQIFVRHQ